MLEFMLVRGPISVTNVKNLSLIEMVLLITKELIPMKSLTLFSIFSMGLKLPILDFLSFLVELFVYFGNFIFHKNSSRVPNSILILLRIIKKLIDDIKIKLNI